MEAQTGVGSSSSPVAYPQWVMLEQYLEIKVEDDSCSPTDDDAKTPAAARTSAGHRIQVSLRLAEPPALSRVCLRLPQGLKEKEHESKVLAAHGDSVLIQVRIKEKHQFIYMADHFVYNAGAATDPRRPPSLSLLPPYYEKKLFAGSVPVSMPRELCANSTGLLRGGDDEIIVGSGLNLTRTVFRLFLFRSGEWTCYDMKTREDWDTCWDTVVPVDGRLLCWVDLCGGGVLLCDVAEETPTAKYVRLPTDPRDCGRVNRNVCATAGGGALKFVNIFGRCCCGAAASCGCEHSRHAYTIHTWTMRIIGNGGNMEWVKDGMLDATELWALDAYKDLPHAPLDRPVVSIDDPEMICFRFRTPKSPIPIWQIMVNTSNKTIHSVSSYKHEAAGRYYYAGDKLIPCNVSRFFNTYPCSSSGNADATLTGQSQDDVDIVDSSSNPTPQHSPCADPACVQAALSEMSEALQEVPSYGLLGADEVKAYRILIRSDNGNRMRSFLRLPKNMRKDWLLMEIKTSDVN